MQKLHRYLGKESTRMLQKKGARNAPFASNFKQDEFVKHGCPTRTCVCETRMPPAETMSNNGKNLLVLHFDPA